MTSNKISVFLLVYEMDFFHLVAVCLYYKKKSSFQNIITIFLVYVGNWENSRWVFKIAIRYAKLFNTWLCLLDINQTHNRLSRVIFSKTSLYCVYVFYMLWQIWVQPNLWHHNTNKVSYNHKFYKNERPLCDILLAIVYNPIPLSQN